MEDSIKQYQELSLVTNNLSSNMFNEICYNLRNCRSFIFSVAFVSYGGLHLLVKALDTAKDLNIKGKFLTSDYQNFTDPAALRKLQDFSNIETKIYLQNTYGGFHTKAYIFENVESVTLYIGSSNITEKALLKNVEWNVKIISKLDHPFIVDVMNQFSELWNKTQVIDDKFLDQYEAFINTLKEAKRSEEKFLFIEETVRPNSMQNRAIANLHNLRTRGEDRGLVIAATATGKTYMSAFDVKQYNPKRMLFLVHREDILDKTVESYKKVLGAGLDCGILSRTKKETKSKYLFSTIQSMYSHYSDFDPHDFEYIVIDETHHAMAPGYQNVIEYFKPKFLLGMTATPERTDGYGVFSFFKNNIALEIRLYEAIEDELVCPFHYFGVREADGIKLADLKDNDIDELTKRLSIQSRVDYILKQVKLYGHTGKKLKCLGFCASLEHAEFMMNAFNQRGYKSIYLSGKDDVPTREKYVHELESDEPESIEVIFTRDVFNEGIDIPSVNMVLMLRPTNSPIIFIQQLGRGLRKIPDKDFVTVIDFIGNYRKSFMMAIALKGQRFYDKESLMISVREGFREVPGDSFVQMDEVSKNEIISQLNNENFRALSYLKDNYFTFKALNNQEIPYFLMDYELFEGSPDPVKFIDKAKSYLELLMKMEKSEKLNQTGWTEDFLKIIRQLSSNLPLKRPIEFSILEMVLKQSRVPLDKLVEEVLSNYSGVTKDTIIHAINNLLGKYLDDVQFKRFAQLINFESDVVSMTNKWRDQITNNTKPYFEDLFKYGIYRYQREFGIFEYQLPFFKLYETYQMADTAQLCNLEKKFSSFRNQGLCRNNKDYFLFIDLNKDADVKDSINYKDKIIDQNFIQWQTPNNTTQRTEGGKNLLSNKSKGYSLHVFVRKFKKVDDVSEPYIYLGKANTHDFDRKSNNPITIILRLETELPRSLYSDLTTIIGNAKN